MTYARSARLLPIGFASLALLLSTLAPSLDERVSSWECLPTLEAALADTIYASNPIQQEGDYDELVVAWNWAQSGSEPAVVYMRGGSVFDMFFRISINFTDTPERIAQFIPIDGPVLLLAGEDAGQAMVSIRGGNNTQFGSPDHKIYFRSGGFESVAALLIDEEADPLVTNLDVADVSTVVGHKNNCTGVVRDLFAGGFNLSGLFFSSGSETAIRDAWIDHDSVTTLPTELLDTLLEVDPAAHARYEAMANGSLPVRDGGTPIGIITSEPDIDSVYVEPNGSGAFARGGLGIAINNGGTEPVQGDYYCLGPAVDCTNLSQVIIGAYDLPLIADWIPGSGCGPLIECVPHGACCFSDWTCTLETADNCGETGLVYLGDGSACEPNPCPSVTGACCLPGEVCEIETQDGCSLLSGVFFGSGVPCESSICENASVPTQAAAFLTAPSPNPARSTVRFAMTLVESRYVTVSVYDVTGSEVATIYEGESEAGTRELQWDLRGNNGRLVPQRTYYLRMKEPANVASREIVVIR